MWRFPLMIKHSDKKGRMLMYLISFLCWSFGRQIRMTTTELMYSDKDDSLVFIITHTNG